MRGNGEWFIFVTLRKPGRQLAFADNILAVDLGVKILQRRSTQQILDQIIMVEN
jgi:hypothetical protein